MKFRTDEFEGKMKKTISAYTDNLSVIRAGRANPEILSRVTVDYYGAETPLMQVADVRASDARTLLVTPWDPSLVKKIEKAILAADVGITPQNDGKTIRLAVPHLTEERRRELKKQIERMGEDSKVAIRNIRRDAVTKAKADKKEGTLTEDEEKAAEKDIQTLTDSYIKEVDAVSERKIKEVMAI
ncbi:MAG: ribosome recycling factor [Firmicutes bacterium]|nr:ribosome recycling factor [Bacillota bacterium]MCD7747354.1 ribosome recycling factor [Bacillota bacterium]MCD7783366.1 ribosome recycling factor [Bacillota bacterium]MCD7788199.1 ribosome recycling factor [Bacillota bacterium]MCD8312454.1 ribosome recycling factor [Bacillota bacterium]